VKVSVDRCVQTCVYSHPSPIFEVETVGISVTILGLRPAVICRFIVTKYKYYLRETREYVKRTAVSKATTESLRFIT